MNSADVGRLCENAGVILHIASLFICDPSLDTTHNAFSGCAPSHADGVKANEAYMGHNSI